MADANTNSNTADAAIVAFYPEIVGIVATLDSLAAVGRKVFKVFLEDTDHGPAIKADLDTTLDGLGYTVLKKTDYVQISF